MSCVLADAQNWPDAGVGFFTHEEQRRISKFRLPGDPQPRGNYGSVIGMYPRKPKVDPDTWKAQHFAKLRSLERAAGM